MVRHGRHVVLLVFSIEKFNCTDAGDVLLLVLERSTAVVVVDVALGTVPVVGGPCGLWGLLALSGPLGLDVLTLLAALLGWLMTPCWECEILSASSF